MNWFEVRDFGLWGGAFGVSGFRVEGRVLRLCVIRFRDDDQY